MLQESVTLESQCIPIFISSICVRLVLATRRGFEALATYCMSTMRLQQRPMRKMLWARGQIRIDSGVRACVCLMYARERILQHMNI
jgi:hypothetical protein